MRIDGQISYIAGEVGRCSLGVLSWEKEREGVKYGWTFGVLKVRTQPFNIKAGAPRTMFH